MDVDGLSRKLSSYLAYLQLMSSLEPGAGNITNPAIKSKIKDAWDFYKGTNAEELLLKGPTHIKDLEPLIQQYTTLAVPKEPIETIASDFNSLCAIHKELYSYGIEYRWLDERMDCSKMGFPIDLPWHTKIGLGHHAGMGSVEEEFLLRDAFFMLASAEEAYTDMHTYSDELKKIGKEDTPESFKNLTLANHNIAAYSRLCIISFFSFVEAFVNSVGHDFRLRNQGGLNPEQAEILNGKKKGRLISIEYKIEKIPAIIRTDKQAPIVISDPLQIKEPFTSFVQQVKAIRDSSVHYSPIKEAIWRKPLDWLEKARTASTLCTTVALEFWRACYPAKAQPQYLKEINYTEHFNLAKERLKEKNESKFFLLSIKNSSIT